MDNSNNKKVKSKENAEKAKNNGKENKLNMPLVCIYFGLLSFLVVLLIYFLTKYAF